MTDGHQNFTILIPSTGLHVVGKGSWENPKVFFQLGQQLDSFAEGNWKVVNELVKFH